MNVQYFILCVCSKAKRSFPPLMITGTIDCNADEQANTARGVQRNLDMFKVLTFMFFHAGMKENADVGGSWLSLRKHDVKQRGSLVKVKRSSAPPSLSSFGISQRQTDRQILHLVNLTRQHWSVNFYIQTRKKRIRLLKIYSLKYKAKSQHVSIYKIVIHVLLNLIGHLFLIL